MHQGKHQEYEKRLHDALIAASGANNVTGIGGSGPGSGSANGTTVIASGTSKATGESHEF